MTGLERLVARALAEHRANLDGALRAIRDYQAALVALEDMPTATADHREFAVRVTATLEQVHHALDTVRWMVPPFPGTRET